jgi:rhodanese-related sulfurtransferase
MLSQKTLSILVVTAMAWIGCRQDAETMRFRLSDKELLAAINAGDHRLTPAAMIDFVSKNQGKSRIIDVRPPAVFEIGHLNGAVNIPLPNLLEPASLKLFNERKTTHVLVGADEREANSAWMMLRQLGFENLRVLQGGMDYIQGDSATLAGQPADAEVARYDFKTMWQQAADREKQEVEIRKPVPAPLPAQRPAKTIVPQKKKTEPAAPVKEEEGC